MKRLIINAFAILLLSVLSFGAWAQTQSLSQSKDELKASIAKMNQEMIDLAKAGRYEAMDKFYDSDVISLPNNRTAEKGYKQVLNSNLQKKSGGYKVIDGQKTTTELFVNGDLLVDVGTYTMTVSFPGPAEPVKDLGKYINVWKKDKNGAWKIVAETWNTDKSTMTAKGQGTGKQDGGPAPAVFPNTNSGTNTQGTTTKENTGTEQKPVMDTKDGKK